MPRICFRLILLKLFAEINDEDTFGYGSMIKN